MCKESSAHVKGWPESLVYSKSYGAVCVETCFCSVGTCTARDIRVPLRRALHMSGSSCGVAGRCSLLIEPIMALFCVHHILSDPAVKSRGVGTPRSYSSIIDREYPQYCGASTLRTGGAAPPQIRDCHTRLLCSVGLWENVLCMTL